MRAKTFVLTVVSVGALALTAGCGPEADSARGNGTQPEHGGLTALTGDVLGSLTKATETTNKAKTLSFSMTGTSAGQQVKAHGAMSLEGDLKAEMTVEDPSQGPITVRMFGVVFYVQVPEKERAELNGKTWIKLDLGKTGAASEEMVRQFRNVDPTQQAKTLIASGQVKAAGQEEIGGVKTVHYTGTTPVATYLQQLDSAMRDTVQKSLTSKGVTEIKTEMWVDAQYQVRRCHMVMGDTDLTSDYADYGKPVNVVEPPAAETTDLADMLGNLDLSDLTA